MNMFGVIQLNREVIAQGIAEKSGRAVKLGRLNWHADSYHIYGKDIEDVSKRLIKRIEEPFQNRVFNFFDSAIQEIYNEAESAVRTKIQKYDEGHTKH